MTTASVNDRVLLPLTLAAAVSIWASGCASTGGVPRPFPLPGSVAAGSPSQPDPAGADAPVGPAAGPDRPADATESSVPPDLYALTGTALSLRGVPYRNGGIDPHEGFDCSGFTQYVFAQYGIALPRSVREQFDVGMPVDERALEPGDLIFFATTSPGVSHVGIALGGDQFVHAPSSTGVVRVERLSSTYWARRYVGARRVN